jgi:uncharacterized membrane protein
MKRSNGWNLLFVVAIAVAVSRVGLKPKPKVLMAENLPTLSFEQDVLPITQNRCVACHNASTHGRNWLDYQETYAKRFLIKQRILDRTMPSGGFPMLDIERNIIVEWINQGARK